MKTLTLAALSLTLACGAALAAKVEDTDPSVSYNGTWANQMDAMASGGGYTSSSTAGSTVTFQFSGTGITLYRELDPTGGTASVMIDNQPWGNISFVFTQRAYQIPAVIDQLSTGMHTIVLTVSTGTVFIDAFESPITVTPTAAQQSALTRINFYRNATGLPSANLCSACDLAAQAHSDYQAATSALAHVETAGTPGFTGVNPGDRLLYFGYDQNTSEDADMSADPVHSIDDWVNTLYHRVPILTYSYADVGWGANAAGYSTQDFGNKHGTSPAARQMTLYPYNNQVDVPLVFNGEGPNPLPAATYPTGYPVTLHFDQPANATQGTATGTNSGTLTDASGNVIPATFLDRNSDPNNFLGDDYAIMPNAPLSDFTTYKAQIQGTDTAGNAFTASWSFRTAPASNIVAVYPGQQGLAYVIQWNTQNAVTSTQLVYGPTTAYGTTVVGVAGGGNSYFAMLQGLAGGVYHYQISATDALGNTRSTPDSTFTAANIPAATVNITYVNPFLSTSVAWFWQTAGAVASTSVQYGLTTAYGMTATSGPQNPPINLAYYAQANGLMPGTTYHYQITATDMQGNTLTTPDMTVTTPAM
jgi:uncharacterized protein YkwD